MKPEENCNHKAGKDANGELGCTECGKSAEEISTTPPVQPDICELMLCEIPHLVLQEGRTYRFRQAPGCAKCAAYVAGDYSPAVQPDVEKIAEKIMACVPINPMARQGLFQQTRADISGILQQALAPLQREIGEKEKEIRRLKEIIGASSDILESVTPKLALHDMVTNVRQQLATAEARIQQVIFKFADKPRGIPQAHLAAELVNELQELITAPDRGDSNVENDFHLVSAAKAYWKQLATWQQLATATDREKELRSELEIAKKEILRLTTALYQVTTPQTVERITK